jgi:predicted SAM-dependent methyltransferase
MNLKDLEPLTKEQDPPYVIIGTRHFISRDWIHVDGVSTPLYCDADGRNYPVDVVTGADRIPLPDASAGLVFSSECLEHFSWRVIQDVVNEWCRLVRPGGVIRIEVPDFEAACQQLLSGADLDLDYRMQQIFFAGQESLVWDAHFCGITHRMLPDMLEKAGMTVAEVKRGWECGWLRADAMKK